jgi:hypothetical protein
MAQLYSWSTLRATRSAAVRASRSAPVPHLVGAGCTARGRGHHRSSTIVTRAFRRPAASCLCVRRARWCSGRPCGRLRRARGSRGELDSLIDRPAVAAQALAAVRGAVAAVAVIGVGKRVRAETGSGDGRVGCRALQRPIGARSRSGSGRALWVAAGEGDARRRLCPAGEPHRGLRAKGSTRTRAPVTASSGRRGARAPTRRRSARSGSCPRPPSGRADAHRRCRSQRASSPRTAKPTSGPIEVERPRVPNAQALGMGR